MGFGKEFGSYEQIFGTVNNPEQPTEAPNTPSLEAAPLSDAEKMAKAKAIEEQQNRLTNLENQAKQVATNKELLLEALGSLLRGEEVDIYNLQQSIGTLAIGEYQATGNGRKFIEDHILRFERANAEIQNYITKTKENIVNLERS
jgi:hypothetical protein